MTNDREALTRDQIRTIFMQHGFTVKEGHADLKPYVYDAADALIRAALAQQAPAAHVAWEYQNQFGKKFLSDTDPNKWHPHDQEGFENFRPLVYAAPQPTEPAQPATQAGGRAMSFHDPRRYPQFNTAEIHWALARHNLPCHRPSQVADGFRLGFVAGLNEATQQPQPTEPAKPATQAGAAHE